MKSWIYSTRLALFVEELQKSLEAAALLISKQTVASTLPVTSKTSSKLKGFVAITSFYIIKGELHIKSEKYNRGHPVKLVIDPNHKVLLSQIKMSSNCIIKCLTQIQRIVKDDLENIPNQISRIRALINQAQNYLRQQDDRKMFPKIHEPTFIDSPLDCSVDFTIYDTNLRTTIHCLSFPDANPIEHALSQLKQAEIIKVSGKNVQIVDKIVVETPIPFLLDLKESFGIIEALCQDFENKIDSL